MRNILDVAFKHTEYVVDYSKKSWKDNQMNRKIQI